MLFKGTYQIQKGGNKRTLQKKPCRLKINGHKIIRRQILYYKHKAGIAVLTPMADSCQCGKNHHVVVNYTLL